ncbi:MAG TPA: SET domain-containing protein-lysine N-methyltransferase [Kofleriaceae bacterium]|nr:SET domain-containing protein-lysine N-methyltransferase [Kofleriaceae bacterium]
MPPASGLMVVPSSIHGYGVRATRRFEAGEPLIEGEGVTYDEDQEFDDTYALVLPAHDGHGGEDHDAPPIYFDLVDQTRWINHSCAPNTAVESAWDATTGRVRAWWVALRAIEPGEELLYDYAFVGALAEPCNCGAPTCRGLIVDLDPDELAAVPAHLRHHLRLPMAARAEAGSAVAGRS